MASPAENRKKTSDATSRLIKSVPSKPVTVRKREGPLYKRSDYLRVWRKRFFYGENSFLKIAHDTEGKNMIIVDVNDYYLTWEGKFKDKFIFTLTMRQGLNRKPKILCLASTDEGVARDWFAFFMNVAVAIYPILISNV